jgi:glutamate dehydrogenase (NAD(P)+)
MMEDGFRFCDELGPKGVLHIHDPGVGLKECFRLARAMTLKNAAAGLAHGGGKAVIFGDPAMQPADKEQIIRAFAAAVRDIHDFIPGPDMGTDEQAMAWVRDEIGRSVGLPSELGGIPLDEIGATGFGICVAADVAKSHVDLDLAGARVAVQGFGSVGKHAARRLVERGSIIVAVADSSGAIIDPAGLDVEALIALKARGEHVVDFAQGRKLEREAIIGVDCDILIPAARPDAVHGDNVDSVKASLIVQGANIGVTEEAEATLHRRGVLCLPDFISNAGGVICAAVEYHDGTQSQAFATIREKISANTAEVLARVRETGCLPRAAAVTMAAERVRTAMRMRRWA